MPTEPADFKHSARSIRYTTIHGSRIAFVEAGSGPLVVLLHGNPTSSYLWHGVIPALTASNRVIAPELIGMGDSEKPDIDYPLEDHCRFVDAFLDSLTVVSTWRRVEVG